MSFEKCFGIIVKERSSFLKFCVYAFSFLYFLFFFMSLSSFRLFLFFLICLKILHFIHFSVYYILLKQKYKQNVSKMPSKHLSKTANIVAKFADVIFSYTITWYILSVSIFAPTFA